MCGIYAFIGNENKAVKTVMEGLKMLEYRGYDSWGIAIDGPDGMTFEKHTGKIGNAHSELTEGVLGIGHTRWATHGGVTDTNAHPHLSSNGTMALVHNGIVENISSMRETLVKEGYSFASETDSEAIMYMFEEQLKETDDFQTALQQTFKTLKGLNAICILDSNTDTLGVIKNGSPLIVGLSDESYHIASDVTAILPHTNKVIYIEDNQGAIITNDSLSLFDVDSGKSIEPKTYTVNWTPEEAGKGDWPHYVIKEIHEQLTTIPQTASLNAQSLKSLASLMQKADNVVLLGCGTAALCGMAAEYTFAQNGVNAAAYGAYEFHPFINRISDNTIVIAISQSGETAETLEAARAAQRKGAHIAALVNARGSTLERLADTVLTAGTGPEIAVVSTKAYTAQLSVLYMLAGMVGQNNDMDHKYTKEMIQKAGKELEFWLDKDLKKQIHALAKDIADSSQLFIIGKYIQYPAALEAALKIKEISYIHAEGFAAGELKHGVIALIEHDTPCIVMTQNDTSLPETAASASEMKARGGKIIHIGPHPIETQDIHISTPDLENITILGNVIAAQLLAYYLTIERGNDPDKPRNLAKSVTVK